MPTTSRSSPTTTSAVNENRRPPLTTLATRLISTTRSCRSRPLAETERSRVAISRSRVAAWIGALPEGPLQPQASLTGAVGDCLHAPVILVSAAIEHGLLDAGRLRALGKQCARPLGLLHWLQRTQLGLGPADRRERASRVVVDQLRKDP